MRAARLWFSLAALLYVLGGVGVDFPVSGTPFLAIGLAGWTSSRLRTQPLRRRIFGNLEVLRVALPGLLYAAAVGALLLEGMEGAGPGAGVGFLVGALAAVGTVLFFGVMRSAVPEGGERVRYVCARCGLGSDRGAGRAPCVHCGLITRIEWSDEQYRAAAEDPEPLTRLWCPACALERLAPRGSSECGACGLVLRIEFNDHATGALATNDGRGLESR